MKKIILLAGILAGTLSSCVDNMKNPEVPAEQPEKVSELIVPAGFDWKTTRNILCDFSAADATLVSVSLSETESPFARVIAGPGIDPVSISIPGYVKDLYISYLTKNGEKKAVKVAVPANSLTYSVPQDSREYITGGEAAVGPLSGNAGVLTRSQDYPVIYYPAQSNGWGTIMFEDLWPSYGDYDFNDLVVNYKVQLYLQNKNKVETMIVGLRIKSIGGSVPNDLYLTLLGVRGGEVNEVELYTSGVHNVVGEAEMIQLNPGNNEHKPAIFRFKNMRQNALKPAGAVYLNTEKGFEMPEDDLVSASFVVYFRNPISLEDISFDKFDFFIATEKDEKYENKEIHLKDFAPSLFGQSVYDKCTEGSPDVATNQYYSSGTGLVWAIHIPADIPHVYEQTDFLKAYPKFKDWAVSGGTLHQDWYLDGNRIKENLVRRK